MVELTEAQEFLSDRFDVEPSEVVLVGEGAWSRCFGFCRDGAALVIRFGVHVDDFRKDQRAYAYAAPTLPIPAVLEIGQAFDGFYAVSTRATGIPLESLRSAQWRAVVPAVASALEAMRRARLPASCGVGGWGAEGKAPQRGWSDHLLAVTQDSPAHRTHGWRQRLAASAQAEATFVRGRRLLERVASDAVPISLVHCDLINRNVLVAEDKLTGVFDWGCSLYGDHLYDLAWFEFWSPWYPELDMQLLRSEVERRWHDVGYTPEDKAARLMACYLHIGLDHLAYNAYRGDWAALSATGERMQTLVAGV